MSAGGGARDLAPRLRAPAGRLPACRPGAVLCACRFAAVLCACRFAAILRACRFAAVACSLAAVLRACRFAAVACSLAAVLRACRFAAVLCACRFAAVLRACRFAAVACSLAAVLCACAPSAPALECAIDADCGANAFCATGQCLQGTRTCPLLEPKLSSIDRGFFQVSCGTGGIKGINCHARDGAATASGLDLSTDPYTNLVNRAAVTTFLPPSSVLRNLVLVTPGDASPDGSFLVRKLQLPNASDPVYGAGMPADAPASICAQAITVVEQWIAQGAQRN